MVTSQRNQGPEEAEPKIPEEWKKLNIADMIDKGWRPRVKTVGDKDYLTLRFGRQERSLGRYNEEKWWLLMDMFPKLKTMRLAKSSQKGGLLRMRVQKPEAISTATNVSIETLAWYQWAQTREYPGTLGDFINEIVHDYFFEKGLERPVVIVREA